MEAPQHITGDRIASVTGMLAALYFVLQTNGLNYNGAIFPRLTAVFLFVLSAVLFLQSFYSKAADKKRMKAVSKDRLCIFGSVVGMLAWAGLLNVLGFVVSGVVFLTALTLFIDTHRITFHRAVFTLGIYSVVVMVVWAFFHMVLLVPLPAGYFF